MLDHDIVAILNKTVVMLPIRTHKYMGLGTGHELARCLISHAAIDDGRKQRCLPLIPMLACGQFAWLRTSCKIQW